MHSLDFLGLSSILFWKKGANKVQEKYKNSTRKVKEKVQKWCKKSARKVKMSAKIFLVQGAKSEICTIFHFALNFCT